MELTPLVSIGMPVYNSENDLRQALDSLLAQDYSNFELIISDNGSTDQTAEICQEYVERDKRVQYYRTETNLGASYNFKRVFQLASGEFFMWAGSHDIWTPDYISRLICVLQADPDVVLAYTEAYWIDEQGNNCTTTEELYHLDTRSMRVLDRIPLVIKSLSYCDLFYGLYRTSVLKKCRIGIVTLGFDHVLLMEISLFGEIAEIPGKGFLRRLLITDENEAKRVETILLRMAPLVYSHRKRVRAWWEMGWQHVLSIWVAPIPSFTKAVIMLVAVKSFYTRFKYCLWNDLFHPVFVENSIEKREIPNW